MQIWKKIFIGMNEIEEREKDEIRISRLSDCGECGALHGVVMVG